MALENYVKFLRGTPAQYEALGKKDKDTLYFITDSDKDYGKLYLGTKLIAGGNEQPETITLDMLKDVTISNDILEDNSVLVYDVATGVWVNQPFGEIFPEVTAPSQMTGASSEKDGESGLVPKPLAGQQEHFLKGDGTWASIEKEEILVDNKSIVTDEKSKEISLKDFGKRFYKFIPEVTDEEGKVLSESTYLLVEVDENNPWSAGLEPRVVLENDEFVLGWFEQNPTTLDGVNSEIVEIKTSILDVKEDIKTLTNNTFTKEEVKDEINTAIASVDHLRRKIVGSYADILTFIDESGADEASKYIFMVPESDLSIEGNVYEEYIVVDGKIEVVGK